MTTEKKENWFIGAIKGGIGRVIVIAMTAIAAYGMNLVHEELKDISRKLEKVGKIDKLEMDIEEVQASIRKLSLPQQVSFLRAGSGVLSDGCVEGERCVIRAIISRYETTLSCRIVDAEFYWRNSINSQTMSAI